METNCFEIKVSAVWQIYKVQTRKNITIGGIIDERRV